MCENEVPTANFLLDILATTLSDLTEVCCAFVSPFTILEVDNQIYGRAPASTAPREAFREEMRSYERFILPCLNGTTVLTTKIY